ncbi:aminopeptidase N [Nesterenkonia flava]|uniref:Aminopeptidase N n=1 Tax=Nesterenkonia flava TaxID=469799 RepID=A0ABU1FQY1_9MICC|nr:aminopeptidase N [Nesterenkonia flava]MDR5710677.1 aminopeptidase N [Nesterenkonia flava]
MPEMETPESPLSSTPTGPSLDRENLTREEAAARSAAVTVSRYEVEVDVTGAAAEGATTYPVTTRVEFSVTGATDLSFLDYVGASVDSLRVNGQQRDPQQEAGTARILLRDLQEGENVVEIRSTSRYSRSGEGLHRFVDPADGQVYLYTQYEPADCKRVFPVFDQPDMKARFTFRLIGPEDWQLRSNSPEISREEVASGVAVTFAETEPISSYITALLAGPYHLRTGRWRDIELAVLCRAALAEHLDAEEILKITVQGLEFFHEEFAYGYPWGRGTNGLAKYDQVFVPEYNLGAMENPGLVTFTESYVFDSAATEAQHQLRATTILHEMAHMWFGDLVTMGWWDDLWLKESFADYMGTLAVDEATDFTTSWIAFASGRKAWAYVQDQLPTTHPIVADITDLEAADQNFDGITYAKGASVLKQLAAFAGRDAFREASRRYFARHAFGTATLRDFLSILQEVTGRDMSVWAQAWLQTSGIPVLSTEIHDDGTLALRQTGIDPTTGETVLRPHKIRIGLHTLDSDGRLHLTATAPVEISPDAPEGLTRIPELSPLPDVGSPRLILPNEGDLTYAKLSLDPESVAAALQYPVADPLARATVWASLWSMTRDSELPAEMFVDAVCRLGLQVPEVSVLTTVLRQADAACERFTPHQQRAQLQQRFAARLAEFLTASHGDLQRAAARTLAVLSRREGSQLDLLAGLLDGNAADFGIAGLTVDEELRWAFLQALAAHGRVTQDQLDAELSARTTARGRIAHRLASAARPEAAVKASAFRQAISGRDEEGQELSNDHLTAVVEGFRTDTSADAALTGDYVVEYFTALRTVWDTMTQGQATRVVRGLYPGTEPLADTTPEHHPVVLLSGRWLDQHDDAPAALRRLIIEEQDHLLRALRAQDRARAGHPATTV